MAITSLADLKTALENGQSWTGEFSFTAPQITNRMIFYPARPGTKWPVQTTFPGTALACVSTGFPAGDGTNRFCIDPGPDVPSHAKYLLGVDIYGNVASLQTSRWMLMDVVAYWPGISLTTLTAQTLTGTPTLTRYPNGEGLRFGLVLTAVTGAVDATNSTINYTNQAGTPQTTAAFTIRQSTVDSSTFIAGQTTAPVDPALPLLQGDTGVQNCTSITVGASMTSGTAALVLYKPIHRWGVGFSTGCMPMDLPLSMTTFPKIPDGACLVVCGAHAIDPNSNRFTGQVKTVWG